MVNPAPKIQLFKNATFLTQKKLACQTAPSTRNKISRSSTFEKSRVSVESFRRMPTTKKVTLDENQKVQLDIKIGHEED